MIKTAASVSTLEKVADMVGGYLHIDRVEAVLIVDDEAIDISRNYWGNNAPITVNDWIEAIDEAIMNGETLPVY